MKLRVERELSWWMAGGAAGVCVEDNEGVDDKTLDPREWEEFRRTAHGMLDDMVDYIAGIRSRPVWQAMPEELRAGFRGRGPVPVEPMELEAVHAEFMSEVLPYALGNVHPGFMGWVNGGGTPVGMVAEMLAAGLNANCGGRDHAAIEVERQVAGWVRAIFGFPEEAAGLFVTGTSMANLVAVKAARDWALSGTPEEPGPGAREFGVGEVGRRLRAYGSATAHVSMAKAMDATGLGSAALRRVETDRAFRVDVKALAEAIREDRRAGLLPFLVVGTVGTVDTGAVDDIEALAELCEREGLWLHVDGAFGALAVLADDLDAGVRARMKGMERAESLAFDFHKWGQVPYDAGFVLVRDGELLKAAFASRVEYLERETRGMAAGEVWPCDLGPNLSRGFQALKVWFTLKVHGTRALGEAIAESCRLARGLAERVAEVDELELMAPVELNIVCFRYRVAAGDSDAVSDAVNKEIAMRLQEAGSVAPSTTRIGGRVAIRAALVNHRTSEREIATLVEQTVAFGRALTRAGMCAANRR